jgi:hypothetical protein
MLVSTNLQLAYVNYNNVTLTEKCTKVNAVLIQLCIKAMYKSPIMNRE